MHLITTCPETTECRCWPTEYCECWHVAGHGVSWAATRWASVRVVVMQGQGDGLIQGHPLARRPGRRLLPGVEHPGGECPDRREAGVVGRIGREEGGL